MQFCPACDNKLYMQIGEYEPSKGTTSDDTLAKAPLTLYCKHCPYSKKMHNSSTTGDGKPGVPTTNDERHAFDPCMSRSNYSSNHPLYFSTVVNKYTYLDPTLPCLSIACHNAECVTRKDSDIKPEVLYVRYNDQDMEFLYLCRHCRHCWHKNEQGESIMLYDFSKNNGGVENVPQN